LNGGGTPSQCGWLKDKYGLSRQVIPTILSKLLANKDHERAKRVMQAMLKMVKIDIKALEDAYNADPVEQ
jgi:predicted 3-demethylubiquinone-9 3-methyltransferase (glyoxalase superfamily)